MVTWSIAQIIMNHLLENVFNLPPNSPLSIALNENGYISPENFLMQSDEVLSRLEYINENKEKVKIVDGNIGLLKVFKQYVVDQMNQGNTIEEDDWVKITKRDFKTFRVRNVNSTNITPIVTTSAQF